MKDIFEAIDFLHSNSYIHRDVKPSNILIDHNFIPYLSDFETVREQIEIEEENEEMTSDIGSLYYSSPEQDEGKILSNKTDIYSFGMIIYYLYKREDMRKNLPRYTKNKNDQILPIENASKWIQKLYKNCVEFNPSKRPNNDVIKKTIDNEIESLYFYKNCLNDCSDDKIPGILLFFYNIVINKSVDQDCLEEAYGNILWFNLKLSEQQNLDPQISFEIGNIFYNGKLVKQDYYKAKVCFELSAKGNNREAQNNLGIIYMDGLGTQPDFTLGFHYFMSSADGNYRGAHRNLGICYENGIGVKQDYSKAIEHYALAADFLNLDVLIHLGDLYLKGIGVKQNISKAMEYYNLACQMNYSNGYISLGDIYYYGTGCAVDYNRARIYYEKAAEQYNQFACMYLGDIYYFAKGIKKNLSKAIKYYEDSIKFGNPKAYCRLGNLYKDKNNGKPNFQKARECYHEAVKIYNDPAAAYQLGNIYQNGYDTKIDYFKAKYYYEISAKQNFYLSYYELGVMHFNGLGSKRDYATAKKCFELSAKHDISFAYIYLAEIYENGYGVKKDYFQFKQNLEKAARLDNTLALIFLGDIYMNGQGIERNSMMAISYYLLAAKRNFSTGLYYMGKLYSTGDIIQIDNFKAIHYFLKCINVKDNIIKCNDNINVKDFESYVLVKNKFMYHSYNDLGLIYITVLEDIKKGSYYMKEAAFAEYPFGQNNFGILNQFFLNNVKYAEHMYKRSSEHHFALAEYNLGYLREKENKIKESIDYYIKASEDEDNQEKFHGIDYKDKRLEISKMFIICMTNLKLANYFISVSNFANAKHYFVKAFSKLKIDEGDLLYSFRFQAQNEDSQNFFKYLKDFILNFPLFNLGNQPNLNFNLPPIINEVKIHDEKNEKKALFKQHPIKFCKILNESNVQISQTDKLEKVKIRELEDPGELFDLAVVSSDLKKILIKEINDIIILMHSAVYTRPYNILFGRINIEKPKPKQEINHELNDINEMFYEGLGIDELNNIE